MIFEASIVINTPVEHGKLIRVEWKESGRRDLNPQECDLTGAQGRSVYDFATPGWLEAGDGSAPSCDGVAAPLPYFLGDPAIVFQRPESIFSGSDSGRRFLLR